MKIYDLATVTPDDDTRAGLEFIDPNEPLRFPLRNARVVHNGSTATITVPAAAINHPSHPDRLVGKDRERRVDRLIKVKVTDADDGGPVRLVGVSESLIELGNIDEEDAGVSFTLENYVCPI